MKFLEFFSKRIPNLPTPNEKNEVAVPCVFHQDSSPSLGINLETGKWKCYTTHCPGHKGGGFKKFEMLLKGEVAGVEVKSATLDPGIIEAHHKVLLQSHTMMELLQKKRGFTMETITKFQLGYDADRVWIPIKDTDGKFVNVRKYKPGAAKDKMVAYGAGYNRARLFPVENLQSDWVLLCEGETDCLLACQLGYPAITTTGGADTWSEAFSEQLKGKRVVICYDADTSGKKGAQQIAVRLLKYATHVSILRLPLAGTKDEKDITNYFVDLGHSNADFNKLIDEAEVVEATVREDAAPSAEVVDLHLSSVGEDEYVGKRIRSTVLIAGKDLAPFQVPYKIGFSCEAMNSEKICDRCGICRAGGVREVALPEYSDTLLKMVNVPSEKLEAIVAQMAGVPERCRKFRHEVKEYANVEAIKAIPEIDFSADNAAYVIRNLYYLGHGLETNHTYKVEAVVMPDPKTQYATALIYSAVPSQDSIEKFESTPEMLRMLTIFRIEETP